MEAIPSSLLLLGIVEDMIPLNKLTKPGFKALLQVLGVKDAPQPKQVKVLLKSYQSSIKDILHEEFATLGSQVALTADSWTSKQKKGFFAVTCHYIKPNWVCCFYVFFLILRIFQEQ